MKAKWQRKVEKLSKLLQECMQHRYLHDMAISVREVSSGQTKTTFHFLLSFRKVELKDDDITIHYDTFIRT
jgi:hypothetical protein